MNSTLYGNQYWKLRKSHGRKRKFTSAEELTQTCNEYFEWVKANPDYWLGNRWIHEHWGLDKTATKRGMSIGTLCEFLGISDQTWRNYRNDEELNAVTNRIEQAMKEWQSTRASEHKDFVRLVSTLKIRS